MNVLKSYASYMAGLLLCCSTACNNGTDQSAKKDSTAVTAQLNKPGTPIKYDSSKRYIFITWDDSPQPPGTVNCKRVFKEEGIKATFFAVGFNQVGPYKKRIMDSIRKEYPQFLLANHSFSHGFNDKYSKFYSPSMTDSAFADFMHNEQLLQVPVKIIRLPGNNTWAHKGQIDGQKANSALVKRLDSLGYTIIGWDLEWRQQARQKAPMESATEMVERVNRKLDEGGTYQQNAIVILSHDRLFEKPAYVDSLRRFISELKKDPRNVFETIDHYPIAQQ